MKPVIISKTNNYFVINKPPGWSVENAPRFRSIESWLLEQSQAAFIVHRLDVETSGIVIVAKTLESKEELQQLWQGRTVKKTYLALVVGEMLKEGNIEQAIERDNKKNRQKVMLLPSAKSRVAITTYKRLAVGEWEGEKVSLIECHPITGRTHQIRVHLSFIGHPIIGDKLYGNKTSEELSKILNINRHLLHAWKLQLPETQEFIAPIPEDINNILRKFRLSL